MTILVTNNAVGSLASSITAVATTITLGTGQGALFPQPLAGQFFYCTLIDSLNNKEIVKATARATNTLTVVRGQDGTAALVFNAADRVELRPVAAIHNNYPQKDTANAFVAGQSISAAAGTVRNFNFQSAGSDRWTLSANASAEAGLNAGSDFELAGYTDAGVLINKPFTVNRATGVITFLNKPMFGANTFDSLESGVQVPMRQAAVPVGWTKVTTYNDAALRIVSGVPSQRAVAGKELTTLMAARTILQANLPNVTFPNTLAVATGGVHTHTVTADGQSRTGTNALNPGTNLYGSSGDSFLGGPASVTTSSHAGHTHAITGSVTSGGSGTALAFDINYVDLYLASKT